MSGGGEDQHGSPGLGIYMWTDGAAFQFVVNQEMGEEFTYGMDPSWINDDPYSDDDLDSENGEARCKWVGYMICQLLEGFT